MSLPPGIRVAVIGGSQYSTKIFGQWLQHPTKMLLTILVQDLRERERERENVHEYG